MAVRETVSAARTTGRVRRSGRGTVPVKFMMLGYFGSTKDRRTA